MDTEPNGIAYNLMDIDNGFQVNRRQMEAANTCSGEPGYQQTA